MSSCPKADEALSRIFASFLVLTLPSEWKKSECKIGNKVEHVHHVSKTS